MTFHGYLRCSTDEQARSGLGLGAQRSVIEREAAQRGQEVCWWCDDGYSGGSMDRPALTLLLASVRRGDVVVVSRIDRLSRSLADFSALLELARREKWALVALDLSLDLGTPQGEFVAAILAAFAALERRMISQRTAEAMAEAKVRGRRFGHRSKCRPEVMNRIERLRDDGCSLGQIARLLTAETVPTPTGRTVWYASSVRSVLSARANDRQAGLVSD